MRIISKYRINENTVYLTGVFDRFAILCSKVTAGDEQLLVMEPPLELITTALLHNGSAFHGAIKSSKCLLGEIKMPAVHISSHLDICLFPTKSSKKQNCSLFSRAHIKKTKPADRHKTEVQLSIGHTYEIQMRQSTAPLKEHIIKNRQNFYLEAKKGFYIRESQQVKLFYIGQKKKD